MAKRKFSSSNNDLSAGLVILIIGGFLLMRSLGFWFPVWFFSWPMILIAVGLVILARHNFQSGFGAFMLVFGGFFFVREHFGIPMEIRPFLVPGGLIIFGLYLILKRNRNHQMFNDSFFGSLDVSGDDGSGMEEEHGTGQQSRKRHFFNDDSDVINAQSMFTGLQKRVLSKNFRGGKASAIFGGTEIDLTQADLAEGAALNIEVAFGGIKLIVPPHWDIQVNMGTVFAAGVEDKRRYPQQVSADPAKVLKIYGSVIFGGVEIKSY